MEIRKNLKEEYLRQSVMTATPSELLVMLFDACIKDLRIAEMALEKPANYMKANESFLKAQKIISEMIATLDMSFEISTQLLPIYEYLLYSIRNMNIRKDLSELPDILDILKSQRDAWEQITKMPSSASGREICI